MHPNDAYILAKKTANRAGVSLTALCKAAGISPGAPCNWKNGLSSPNTNTLKKLLDAAERIAKTNPYAVN